MAHVQQLLRVHRMVGHETLTEMLAERVSDGATHVSAWITSGGPGWNRRFALDNHIADVVDLIPEFDTPALHSEQRRVAEAASQAENIARQTSNTEARIQALTTALRLSDQLEDVRGQGPGLETQLDALDREIGKLLSTRAGLDDELSRVAKQEHRNEQARSEFDKAQRHLQRREIELRQALAHFQEAARAAGIPANPDAVVTAMTEAVKRDEQLKADLPRVNQVPMLVGLLQSLSELALEAEASGIADAVLLHETASRRSWTVAAFRRACQHQAETLARQSPTEEAEHLAEQIRQAEEQLTRVSLVAEAERTAEEAKLRLESALARAEKAATALPQQTRDAFKRLLTLKSENETRIGELKARREQISQARTLLGGGLTEQILIQQLTTACQEAGVEQSRIRPELTSAEMSLDELKKSAGRTSADLERATSSLDGKIKAIVDASLALQAIPWIPEVTKARLAATGADADKQLSELRRIAKSIDAVRVRLDLFTFQAQAIADALTGVSAHFRGGVPAKGSWVPSVHSWIRSEVQRWFDHPEVRDSLFDGGENVELDLATMEVSWTAGGRTQTRPLQAFSSGEQALAYTRARLARLEREDGDPANRLIALDEFGAFISSRGMAGLRRYLHDRRRAMPQDQIVVILPLPEDSRMLPTVPDSVADARREQLRSRGYLTESLPI
ncbi:hypothetical protein ACN28C_12610 [Plantactinospora sp. WMMC1484]|uniref:hypothetical protein n=1 Tax=Plantactinospora sp. WMMC1484 TaxID=3404122 RepID=UPI003BF56E41